MPGAAEASPPSRCDRGLEHSGGQSAPAGMRGADRGPVARREQHGQAVGDLDHAQTWPGERAISGVRMRRRSRQSAASGSNTAVPCTCSSHSGSAGSASRRAHAPAVLGDRRRGIPDVRAQLSESKGAALTPPLRSVKAACTRARHRPLGPEAVAAHSDRAHASAASAASSRRKVLRQRRLPLQQLAAHRVRELEPRRVQRLARERLAAPPRVRRLRRPAAGGGRRTPDPRPADNRCAPDARGSGGCARSRAARARSVCARKRLHHAVVRDRSAAVGAHRHAGALRAMPADRLIDGAAAGHHAVHTARYSRSISRAAMAATSAVCASGVRATTSRPLVSLSSRWTSPARGTRASFGIQRQQRVLQRVPGVAGARVHHQPRRLVDDEERAVLVQHLERQRLGSDPSVPRRSSGLDAHLLAAEDLVAWPRSGRPSTCTAPASIQSCSRAREYWGRAAGQGLIEAQAGALRGQPQARAHGTPALRPRSEVQPGDSLYCRGFRRRDSHRGVLFRCSCPERRAAACSRCVVVLFAVSVTGCHAPQREAARQRQPRGALQDRPTRPCSAYDFNTAIKTYER